MPTTTNDVGLLASPIETIAVALRARETSSEALTAAAIELALAGPVARLNAFIRIRSEAALQKARDLDAEACAGHWRGLLHGIPLAHKDCFEREGEVLSLGSAVGLSEIGRTTSYAIQRLDAAGAVDLGALNLSEMVAGPTGQNPRFGDCLNARDPSRISGGSSSGSATAVAAGVVAGSLGSDTGGSIRLPAAMQGIYGLKPTYGRVSRRGCFPRAWSLDCTGPLARCARDCSILLQAIAGHDPGDATSLLARVPDYLNGLLLEARGSRLAVLDTGITLDASIAEAFKRFVAVAEERYGASRSTSFPEFESCYALGDVCAKTEAAAAHGPWMRDRPMDYSQAVYSRTEPGLHLPAVRYLEALSIRPRLLEAFINGPLADADVVMLPTVPVEVPKIADADMEAGGRVFGVVARLTALTRPFSYLGLPVLSMPIGVDGAGMPIGAQLIGRPLAEGRLLAMADALSRDLNFAAGDQPNWRRA